MDCPNEQSHGPGVTAALEQKTHCESGKLRGGGRDGGGARTETLPQYGNLLTRRKS